MKRLILMAVLSAVVFAKPKPETYKETEDFQYSRSSSDDGTKSGFYGAQRGNMGGNYERAHNMDTLAQHQMSGLVKQVDGDLGDGVKTRTGSVYTAANSRGIYGSGHYDLSNLQGRNFAEGESLGHSQSHSSLSSHNSRYGSRSYSGSENSADIRSSHSHDARYSGYETSRHADQIQTDNLQAVDTSGLGRYENNDRTGYNMKYHTQFGSRGRNEFEQSSANLHSSIGSDANSQAHYITTPVRVVVRPGGRVAIPITAPNYAVSQNILADNNGINTDAEVINQHVGSTPTNKVKHYEASYSYRKQWEKHHSIPEDVSIVVPTENPFPKNSELYEDAQLLQSSKNQFQGANSQVLHSGNINSQQGDYTRAASSRSRFHAGYNSQQSQSGFESQHNQADFNSQQRQSGLSSQQTVSGLSSLHSQSGLTSEQSHLGLNSQQDSTSTVSRANTYGGNIKTSNMAADLNNLAVDVNSKPKSYHSSYSYHKSWERQGDPYVIKPVGPIYDGQASERLTAASSNSGAYSASSRQYGSHSRQSHQSYSADCDDLGHLRVARSYNTDQELEQGQNQWEDLGQQTETKFENLEDLGQQTETKFENIEDLGQQQQSKWDNLQDLGQQSQNKWENLQQIGQENQNQWDNLQQLGQQTQNQWDNLQQLGQQTEGKLDNLEDLGQQTHRDLEQHQNENLEDFILSQKQDTVPNFEQQANGEHENFDTLYQHDNKENPISNFEQQANGEHESLSNSNNWDQATGFETQSNISPNEDSGNQQFVPVNVPNNNRDIFNHNQQNEWYMHQTNTNTDKNADSYDFMKSISQWTDNTAMNSQQHEVESSNQNLFPTFPSSNSEYNKYWHENKQQDVFWNTNHKYEHNFWHMNNFNNYNNNNEYEAGFLPSSTTSDSGNPLQGLWSKIDSIAGEVTASGSNIGDTKLFGDDFSNFNSQNQNVDQLHNEYDSNDKTVDKNIDLANNKMDTESAEKQLVHNLFDEQTDRQNISTTILPIVSLPKTPTPMENTGKTIDSHEQQPTDNENQNKKDEGRGDIGPEETLFETATNDKPYKTPQEIETLSLTKETQLPKESDAIIAPSSIINEKTGKELNVIKLSQQQEKPNENRQHEFISTVELRTTTIPTVEISTTVKSYNNLILSNQSVVGVLDLSNNPTPELYTAVPHQQIVKNIEIPEDVQQQNLEQKYEGFSQPYNSIPNQQVIKNIEIPDNIPQQNLEQQYEDNSQLQSSIPNQQVIKNIEIPDNVHQQNLDQQYEDISQLQSSWLPTGNLHQGYDQVNVEQQFEDFQQRESIPDKNYLQDFGQDVQSPLSSIIDVQNKQVEQGNPSQNQDTIIPSHTNNYEQNFQPYSNTRDTIPSTPKVMESIHVGNVDSEKNVENQQVEDLKSKDVQHPIEVSTEKPGFWKSIGNKFSSAKSKVVSWFSGS